ncbi:MAG TPA: hypothetical protein VN609_10995 [Propionibacteriaceae bacterium]|nr:hypothetical protein [Propionibacteriaceae bacterium]
MILRLRYTLRSYRGIALARALWHRHVRRYEAEVCKQCGRPIELVWWCSDDRLWELVTGNQKPKGKEPAGGTWCIPCFDRKAQKVGAGWIEWAPLNLRHLGWPPR